MTVKRNVAHKLEKCFDMQKFTKAEHFSGKIGGPSGEGMRGVGMYSMEGAKPGFGKINNGSKPPKFQSEHHAQRQNRSQACMCMRALVKTEGNMQLLYSLFKKKKKKKRKSKYFSTF